MKNVYVFLLIVTVLLLITCENKEQENSYLCKCLLIDLGDLDRDYLIEVTYNGIMVISSGEFSDDFHDKVLYEDEKMTKSLYNYEFFKKVDTKDTVRLAHEAVEKLKECISKIKNVKLINPFVQGNWKDARAHMIIINDNKYVFVYVPSENFSEFLKTLFELTHREWKDRYGREIRLDYDERWVHKCQRPDSIKISCWEKVKGWFD